MSLHIGDPDDPGGVAKEDQQRALAAQKVKESPLCMLLTPDQGILIAKDMKPNEVMEFLVLAHYIIDVAMQQVGEGMVHYYTQQEEDRDDPD